MRKTTCNWIKKILDEATRIVNVFLIPWFLYFFYYVLVKYDFILRYEAWVNAIRASNFIESFPQISAKSVAFPRNLLGKLSRNRPFFTVLFSAKPASKIPAKFHFFFRDLPEALCWAPTIITQIALQLTSAHSYGGRCRVGRNENVTGLKPFYAFQWLSL